MLPGENETSKLLLKQIKWVKKRDEEETNSLSVLVKNFQFNIRFHLKLIWSFVEVFFELMLMLYCQ